MHQHDDYGPHSHEIRADHGGVAGVNEPLRANEALASLRAMRDAGKLGHASTAFEYLDQSLSEGGVLPEAWRHARRV